MKLCIISGGTIQPSFVKQYLKTWKPDCILAADHGLAFCYEQGIRPDYVVGDFDSTDPEIVQACRDDVTIPVETYLPEKDMTDTDIAIRKAVSLGADQVILFGATGTRMDHTLSNIYNLLSFCERGIPASIVDPYNRITMLAGGEYRLSRQDQFGNRISLFPFREEVTGVTLSGVKYPVRDARLVFDNGGMFVSNEITEQEAFIFWKSGTLLLMETRDQYTPDEGGL